MMLRQRSALFSLLFAASGLLGLGLDACSAEADLSATPDIAYGEVICEQCGMIISEETHAAAYRLADGGLRIFDDLGDMVLYHRLNDEDVIVFWVHDYQTGEWIHAPVAYYVATDDLVTPMGHGIVAFTNETESEYLAGKHGAPVYRWDDLLAGPLTDLQRNAQRQIIGAN